jgi:DNA-binding NarL/FixJ family response regulator
MSSPLFITMSKRLSPNWLDAFPEAELQVGLPEKFDRYNDSIIYLDFSGLETHQKQQWLLAAIATDRKVVVLSLVPDNEEALAIIKQGAVGYGHSLTASNKLREINLVVSHGGLWVGRKLMKRIMGALENSNPTNSQENSEQQTATSNTLPSKEQLLEKLTKREAAVAEEVARGASNQEISAKLSIKERTVKAHITSVFSKLNTRNRVGLALLLNNIDISKDPMDI